MTVYWLRSWTQSFRTRRAAHRSARPFRPAIFRLEDRLAPATFTVNSSGDADLGPNPHHDTTGQVHDASGNPTGVTTLRSALAQDQADGGGDTVKFAVTSVTTTGVSTSSGATLQGGIDGQGHPTVTINGGVAIGGGSTVSGLFFTAGQFYGLSIGSGSVTNCVLSGNAGFGLETGGNSTVSNCFIGTNSAGTAALPNGSGSSGGGAIVGGASTVTDCVISGNQGFVGLDLSGNGTLVTGCKIGTDITGLVNLGNAGGGVWIFGGNNNTVGGTGAANRNIISGNSQGGVVFPQCGTSATSNLIVGNYIGVDATGGKALPNGSGGIVGAGTSNNTIGGTTAGLANVISGNSGPGIELEGDTTFPTNGNIIRGNFIGTDDGGDKAVPNTSTGIVLQSCGTTTIGGTQSGAGNTISGNGDGGISIETFANTGPSSNNVIQGNFIGTKADGTEPIPNQGEGVFITDSTDHTTIGGGTAEEANVISGNTGEGIFEFGGSDTMIQGNYIGTNAALAGTLGNGATGIFIESSSNDVIGAPVGSNVAALGNHIAFNGQIDPMLGDGVAIASGSQDTIRLNSIFKNQRLGIDLNNDYFDEYNPTDFGKNANDSQWHPTIIGVNGNTITWMLNAPAGGTYTIDVYSDPSNGYFDYAEGETPVDTIVLGAALSTSVDDGVTVGHWQFTTNVGSSKITATATDASGDTSEFSLADEDGDGLCDTWEANKGIDINGDGTLDVTLPNANIHAKDLYVAYDSMTGYAPVAGALSDVQNVFATHGITLHLDAGQQNLTPAAFGGANPWVAFDAIKVKNFVDDGSDPSTLAYEAKLLSYRYCIFGVSYSGSGSSGLSEILGNDFMVTLQGIWGGRDVAQQTAVNKTMVRADQSGTFLHELGHTLGLSHVGPVNWWNGQPNSSVMEHDPAYDSVMNYRYQGPGIGFFNFPGVPGLIPPSGFISDPQILDYSEAGPNEWANLWFAFQENAQSLPGADTSTEPPDETPDGIVPFATGYAVGADVGGGPAVKVYNANGALKFSFFAYDPGFTGGVRVATADFNGDGVPDVVTATGPGGGPHVEVFDGASGKLLASFFAYGPGFAGGVSVAAADVNGDGVPDIITGAGPGGGPHVEVIDGTKLGQTQGNGQIADSALLASFFAYDPGFTNGVRVAAGDVNGDGHADIITGAGPGGGPHVQVFDGAKPRTCWRASSPTTAASPGASTWGPAI